MKVLIIGGGGQVGTDLRDLCRLRGYEVRTFGPQGCDAQGYIGTDKCRQEVGNWKPDVVYNCAALHDVAKCEKDYQDAFKVNAFDQKDLVQTLAGLQSKAKVVYVSTDYVFPGNLPRQYSAEHHPRPVNIYGMSKALGEYFTLKDPGGYVARLSYVYGHKPSKQKGGSNLVDKLLKQIKEYTPGQAIEVTKGIQISTVSSKDAARMLLALPEQSPRVYHCVNQGWTDLKQLALTVAVLVGKEAGLEVVEKDPEECVFKRPMMTALVPNVETRGWPEALREYLSEKGEVPYFKKPIKIQDPITVGKI